MFFPLIWVGPWVTWALPQSKLNPYSTITHYPNCSRSKASLLYLISSRCPLYNSLALWSKSTSWMMSGPRQKWVLALLESRQHSAQILRVGLLPQHSFPYTIACQQKGPLMLHMHPMEASPPYLVVGCLIKASKACTLHHRAWGH